ncbi:type VII secretion integral membrane protein EccD [Prescottella subtropica]|uniref:type VII secretion integral membrane protein EccD n=1 Tax=Prescottella subtropica TaxID=2545757 RepID=UPI001F4FED4A|nr:type VII secretion integral membrane protein EccD [Prescottella subtropica]
MTIVDTTHSGTGSGGTRERSDLVRLTVLAPHTQIDLALPGSVPVELLVPGIADLVRKHSDANDFDAGQECTEPARWVLSRLGTPPLSPALSLHEHGVLDGEVLVFGGLATAPPPPLFDDVMYNVAVADTDHTHPWTPRTARLTGCALAVVAAAAGALALLQVDGAAATIVGAVAALLVAVLLVVAGVVVGRVYRDSGAAVTLGAAALPVAFAAGVLAVPGDRGAPHLLLGCVAAGTAAVLALRASGVGHTVFTAAATVSLFGAVAALGGTLTGQTPRTIGALLACAALLGLAASPRVAMLVAKLPLPPVPAPGTAIDPGEDVTDGPDSALPSFASVEARAERARRVLTGLVCATALLTGIGALTAAAPSNDRGISWPAVALAVASAAVLMFRGRTYTAAQQAVPLVAGGATILVLLGVGAAVTVPGAALGVFAVAAVAVVAGLVLGIVTPNRSFSPVQRRAAELVDYAAIAAIVPLACWASGLFAAVRGL